MFTSKININVYIQAGQFVSSWFIAMHCLLLKKNKGNSFYVKLPYQAYLYLIVLIS